MAKYRVEMNTPNGGQVNLVTEAANSHAALVWATTKMILDGMLVMVTMGISPLTVVTGTLNSIDDGSLSVKVFEVYKGWGSDEELEEEIYAY